MACHNASAAGGLNMLTATTGMTNADLGPLCGALKFYNGLDFLAGNTNPNGNAGHPFKWTAPKCGNSGFAPTCFNDFNTALTNWRNADP